MTVGISRANIYRGPGTVQLGAGPVMYSIGDIEAVWDIAPGQAENSIHGRTSQFINDRMVKVTLTPAAQVTAAMVAALYPSAYLNPTLGAGVFGASDTALLIHGIDGRLLTIHNAAITRMPDLILSPTQAAFGQMELTGLIIDAGDPTDDDSYYTESSSAWSDTSYATANELRLVYAAAWGTLLTDIKTEGGWTLTPELNLTPQECDDVGTVEMYIQGAGMMAKCTPLNLSLADGLSNMRLQGTGNARGASLRQGENLVITGTGSAVVATLNDAALIEAPKRWGTNTLRNGEIGFVAERTESTGTFGAFASIAIS
jgi:hypothetical protein